MVELKWERGRRVAGKHRVRYWPGVEPDGHCGEVIAPVGTGTPSPTITWKREKGALSPLSQRANDTINTFGLRARERQPLA